MAKKINSRAKGKAGERELINLIKKKTGVELARNLQQSDCGGSDIINTRRFSIEIKRTERIQVWKFWEQAVDQAEREGRVPLLAFRSNKKPWLICMSLDEFLDHFERHEKTERPDRG